MVCNIRLEAIIGVVSEMGRMTKLPTPIIDATLALVRLREQVSGTFWVWLLEFDYRMLTWHRKIILNGKENKYEY